MRRRTVAEAAETGRAAECGGGGTAGTGDLDLGALLEKVVVLPAKNSGLLTRCHEAPRQIPNTNIKCENLL